MDRHKARCGIPAIAYRPHWVLRALARRLRIKQSLLIGALRSFRLRTLAGCLCMASVFGGDINAAARSQVVVKEIVKTMKNDVGQAIILPRGHLQLVVSTYGIAPGARLPQHKHPFQRYAYVIRGRIRVVQAGSSSRIYHAGEFIAESINRWHYGEAVGATPVKLLVIDQLPPGRSATLLQGSPGGL